MTAGAAQIKKTVCTHCSVGCTVMAEVSNGVWTGQEPGWDSPINLGAHCAKGASVRETASGERRLKYPMKLVGGKWTRMSWDDAINEIGDKMLDIRNSSGQIQSTGWVLQSITTNRLICSESCMLTGAQTTVTIRHVFVTQPLLQVWPILGVMAR